MHIKEVIMEGFRSFKEQRPIEPFSPRHNVIVGRNGSGKSNFFDAIQYVLLNQRFSNLRTEERQVLLHEGAGVASQSAYVELRFDNSDGRLAQECNSSTYELNMKVSVTFQHIVIEYPDGEEVRLRRYIGLKKDEFFVNGKRVTKQEVSSLLESAGFSKSNPYYIVQQGKVNTLALMKDVERLNLLKEVAGTKVYEERRQESLHIIDGLQNKCEKIQTVITGMEERLAELEEEKEELGLYQKYDKQKRALEYTLYDKEVTKALASSKEKETALIDNKARMRDVQEDLDRCRIEASVKEKKLEMAQTEFGKLEKKHTATGGERLELLAVRGKLELEVNDLQERVSLDKDEQKNLAKELEGLERTIAEKEQELETEAVPANEVAQASVDETETKLREATSNRDELYAKQSRGSKFKTAAERDAFLQSQVTAIQASARDKTGTADRLAGQADDLKRQVARQNTRQTELEEELKQRVAQSQTISTELMQKTIARNELAEQRKNKWRALEELQDHINEQKSALEKSRRDLRYATPRAVASGLEAVRDLTSELRLEDSVFGPVYENFVLRNESYATAVEVAGGNAIFNVIVDTDDTAAKLMTLLERRRLGRVTFMPLNRLKPRQKKRPELGGDVRHLIEVQQANVDFATLQCAIMLRGERVAVKFRKEVQGAMEQIFGKKILARDLETASRFSESQDDVDVITMTGDEFNRKGGISGGYYDQRAGRLLPLEQIRRLTAQLKDLAKKQKDLQEKEKDLDQAVANVMADLQKLEVRRSEGRNVMAQQRKELGLIRSNAQATAQQLQEKEELLEQVRREAQQDLKRAQVLEAEMGTPLLTNLAEADQRKLMELNTDTIPALNERLKTAYDALEIASERRSQLQSMLNESLKRRREEIREKLDIDKGGIGGSAVSGEAEERLETLALKREELAKTERSLEALRSAREQLSRSTTEVGQQVTHLGKEVQAIKDEENGLVEQAAEVSKVVDRLQQKHALSRSQVEQNQDKKQGLGTLPLDQHEQYKRLDTKTLMKKLNEANENLKRFSHVNKKALEQYVTFSEQREALLKRKQETDKGEAAIKDLIDSLDQQKDEAILRTFKGVSQNFSQVFQELVPSGSGRMIIKTSADAAAPVMHSRAGDDDEEQDDDDDNQGRSRGKGKGKGKAKDKPKANDNDKRGDGSWRPVDEAMDTEEKDLSATSSISDFVGVQVKVSFSPAGETFLMSQLSGGQKAVVALALIFAIQRCDPAPFYLFDEIDQALDSSYRAAVASLIQRQAHSSDNPTQFITTTFRPEMVEVASKCYGISHQNKVSNIHELPRDQALGFVANIMNEEEAVGADVQQPSSSQRTPQHTPRASGQRRAEFTDKPDDHGGGARTEGDPEDHEQDGDVMEESEDEEEGAGRQDATATSAGKKRRVSSSGRR